MVASARSIFALSSPFLFFFALLYRPVSQHFPIFEFSFLVVALCPLWPSIADLPFVPPFFYFENMYILTSVGCEKDQQHRTVEEGGLFAPLSSPSPFLVMFPVDPP